MLKKRNRVTFLNSWLQSRKLIRNFFNLLYINILCFEKCPVTELQFFRQIIPIA